MDKASRGSQTVKTSDTLSLWFSIIKIHGAARSGGAHWPHGTKATGGKTVKFYLRGTECQRFNWSGFVWPHNKPDDAGSLKSNIIIFTNWHNLILDIGWG
jgi:hypothetical protein